MHASGHLREAFLDKLEEGDEYAEVSMSSLIAALWNCTDVMPSWACDRLDLPSGSSYAQGVRSIRTPA